MIRDLLALLEARSAAHTEHSGPLDATRCQGLESILEERERNGIEQDLLELLFGDRLLLWSDGRAGVATTVNIANFVWGINVLPKPAARGWLLWNLENLHAALGGTVSGVVLVRAIEEVSATVLHDCPAWLRLLIEGAPVRRGPLKPVPRSPQLRPMVITIPSFRNPESVSALLQTLEESSRRFGWESPVAIFDASDDPERAAQIRALASSFDAGQFKVAYLGPAGSHPRSLPGLKDFSASHRPSFSQEELSGMFNPMVGGNLNVCFSYFGPDVTVLNFDHDVLPAVDVPEDALSTLSTSDVSLADDVVRFEARAEATTTRRLPVDFMHALRTPSTGFVIKGREVVEGDDESYKLVRLGGDGAEAEYAVGHISGVQDHSARYLLELIFERGESFDGASPPRFIPRQPVFPALVTGSKLTTTTMTLRRHDLSDASIGFVGTGIRVQDFLTGAFQRSLTGRPVLWSPVYLLHNRKYGLRGEAHYGEYLLNEEYMYVFLDLCGRLDAMGVAGNWKDLLSNWSRALEEAPFADFIDTFLGRADDLQSRLRRLNVDSTYHVAADSIREAFRLREPVLAARGHHLARILQESDRVISHLKRRPEVNQLGRIEGARRLRELENWRQGNLR